MAAASLGVPKISQAELASFYESHFGQSAVEHFATNFMPLDNGQHYESESHDQYQEHVDQDDDGLGYYEDGVKRTLTDEQIAIFRHSELGALRRANEARDNSRSPSNAAALADDLHHPTMVGSSEQLSDGEVPTTAETGTSKKKRRKRTKTRVDRVHAEKPDLRKRTWDVVETGLGSLDYGDDTAKPDPTERTTQRRRISYDD